MSQSTGSGGGGIGGGIGGGSNSTSTSLFSKNSKKENISAFVTTTKQPSKIEKKSSPSFLQGKKENSIFQRSHRLLNLQRPKTPNLFNY